MGAIVLMDDDARVYRQMLLSFARTGQPLITDSLASALNLSPEQVEQSLNQLEAGGSIYRHPETRVILAASEQCPSINFFCSSEHLDAWHAAHADTRGDLLTMDEAFAIGSRVFGNLLKQDSGTRPRSLLDVR